MSVMARKPLVLVKPAKPISQMTDAERKAYADRLFEQTAPEPGSGGVRSPQCS
jgi:hypothetical protein